MEVAKIRLSEEEAALIMRADWILTKNRIQEKVKQLLAQLVPLQQNMLQKSNLPDAIKNSSPKISRGENYQGLPYMVLDYPRVFEKDNIFAIRSLFWWGNFFSITLHLSGTYKKQYQPAVCYAYQWLIDNNYSVCINADQWLHDFDRSNYIPVNSLLHHEFSKLIEETSFIKLAQKITLDQWGTMEKELLHLFHQLIRLTGLNYQGDEKDLLPDDPITGFDL
jgi:hypothetical protein